MMTRSHLDTLSEDILYSILLYCDFETACNAVVIGDAIPPPNDHHRRHSKRTNNSTATTTTTKTTATTVPHEQLLWKEIFQRHGFSSQDLTNSSGSKSTDLIEQCKQRRQLLFNLMRPRIRQKQEQKKKNKNHVRLGNLPHCYFHFFPVIPMATFLDDDDNNEMMMMTGDTPPVFYECDSYVLTSTGTSPELLFLNPFDGSLTVLKNCLNHCVPNDNEDISSLEESMMMMIDTNNNTHTNGSSNESSPPTNTTPAAAAGSSSRNTTFVEEAFHSTQQTLLGTNDYFCFDIAPRFPQATNRTTDEYDLSHLGLESKPVFDISNDNGGGIVVVGTMVAFCRNVRNLSNPLLVCTELISWTKRNKNNTTKAMEEDANVTIATNNNDDDEEYGEKRIIRAPYEFRLIHLDANHNRIVVSIQGDNNNNNKLNQLQVYPMILQDDDDDDDVRMSNDTPSSSSSFNKYFPDPIMTITCQHPITTCAVDSVTGNQLLVVTKARTIEIWNLAATTTAGSSTIRRTQILNCVKCLRKSIEDRLVVLTHNISSSNHCHRRRRRRRLGFEDCEEAQATSTLYRQVTRFQESNMESIHVPKHLTLEQGGFVTLQHSQREGTSLLLWRRYKDDDDDSFRIVSLINLPLWSRRIPRIHYDGTRLIVAGQDHIGAIILIYHCATPTCQAEMPALMTQDNDNDDLECNNRGDGSGGVYNLTTTRGHHKTQLVNRIRHAALGGLNDSVMDSMHMTCNERFLIINTRTGNLLGTSPIPEGLLVIDLQEEEKARQIVS
eukprot:scaffold1549_cov105-Cylindrotheca_fusiformis.AAC.13